MATVANIGESFSVGRVFSRGFGVIADNPVTVLGIAFLFGAIPSMLVSWLQQRTLASRMDAYQMIGSVGVVFGALLVSLVIQAFVQGSLVRATLAFVRGERATFAECLGASLSVLLPLIGLAILLGLGVWFGFALLIVPGIILYVMWSVASPALVAERIGIFAAFGRSRELTRGYRWKVLGVEALLFVAYYIFLAIIAAITLALTGANLAVLAQSGLPIGWLLITIVSSTVVNTVWSTVQTSLYVALRDAKEGLPEEALHEIFA